MMRDGIRWMFEDRKSGRLVIAQAPNLPLWVFLGAWLASAVFHPSGRTGLLIKGVELFALTIWAADEVFRGVNPWRRMLGAGGLVYVLIEVLRL